MFPVSDKKKTCHQNFSFKIKYSVYVKWKITTIRRYSNSRGIEIPKTRFASKISSSSDSIMPVKPMHYLHNFQDVQKLPSLTICIRFQLSASRIA